MTKRVEITVTEDDVFRGYPNSAALCPIARAIRRDLDCYLVEVYPHYAEIGEIRAAIPREATAWVEAFDAEEPVPTPFTFTIELPTWADVPESALLVEVPA
jgi:hypothetical protein